MVGKCLILQNYLKYHFYCYFIYCYFFKKDIDVFKIDKKHE